MTMATTVPSGDVDDVDGADVEDDDHASNVDEKDVT